MMQLTYLYHSGFVLSAPGVTVVIDYFEDTESATDGLLHRELLHRPGRLYVLSSHFHADHFNEEILEWRQQRPDTVYVLSDDIRRHRQHARQTPGIHWIRKGQEYADDFLRVRAFGSTDVGVSFWLQLQGRTVFHAGDLNNWHWMDESPEEEWRGYERAFLRELEDIRAFAPAVDVALFPADPRLGKEFLRGPRQWITRIRTSLFVPMHFDEQYRQVATLSPWAREQGTEVWCIQQRGETYMLEAPLLPPSEEEPPTTKIENQ